MVVNRHNAFAEQFARSQHRVYGYIVTLLPNRDDADDAFQETCVVLWEKWSQWDPRYEFTAWAYAIARNVVRNFRRRRQRSNQVFGLPDDLLEEIAAVRVESESLLEARGRALSECLDKLPTSQRQLIEQAYLGGAALMAVADRLAITRSALYLRLYRIRRALHDCIQRSLAGERLA